MHACLGAEVLPLVLALLALLLEVLEALQLLLLPPLGVLALALLLLLAHVEINTLLPPVSHSPGHFSFFLDTERSPT